MERQGDRRQTVVRRARDRRPQDEGAPAIDRPPLRAERPGPGRGGDLRSGQGAGRVVRVLVLGVSTRAMVESAVGAGHEVVAVDFFGDRDQARLAESYALQRDLGLPLTAAGLAEAARRMDADAVVYLYLIHISEPTRLGMISYAV